MIRAIGHAWFGVMLAMLAVPPAHAGLCFGICTDFETLNLRSSPASPSSSQSFELLADNDPCYFFTGFLGQPPQSVEVDSSVVRVLVPIGASALCLAPLQTHSWRLDPLPPGDYIIEFHVLEEGENVTALAGTLNLSVSPAASRVPQPAVVPASGPGFLLILGLMMALCAAGALGLNRLSDS